MKHHLPILLAAAALAMPADATRKPATEARDALSDYVRARAANDLGEFDVAAVSYAAAARAEPGDRGLAVRTFRQATAAGDVALALKSARDLDRAGALPSDGTVLLLADAVRAGDWRRASALTDRVQAQKLFAFLAPTVRAWIEFGRRRADPQGLIDAAQATTLAAAFATEHRVLLLIAGGDTAAGAAAFTAIKLPDTPAATRYRVTVAATLAAKRDVASANAVLVGDDPAILRARALLAGGRPIAGAVDTPAEGIARLLVRVAGDVDRRQAGTLALEFARVAAWLSPGDSEAWLVTASLLAGAGDTDASLAALSHVAADDPFIGTVRDARLALLVRAGRKDEALALAKAGVDGADAGAGDWARYGDLLGERDRNAEAAAAYAKAATLAGARARPADAWPLLLQKANAELEAGDWPTARVTAEKALAIAPDQPATLNFLGYSELDHGGDVRTASALIAKASALAPDDASITDSLGWSWYVRGDLAKAIPLLEQAARGAPAATDINEHLGDAYWAAGRRLDARYAWRAALVAADPAQTTRLRAKIDGGPPAPAPPTRS